MSIINLIRLLSIIFCLFLLPFSLKAEVIKLLCVGETELADTNKKEKFESKYLIDTSKKTVGNWDDPNAYTDTVIKWENNTIYEQLDMRVLGMGLIDTIINYSTLDYNRVSKIHGVLFMKQITKCEKIG